VIVARKSNVKRKEKFTVAIVGEGITEWHYFNDLKHIEKYKFEIKPDLPKHSDFNSIINKAKELIKKGYDIVYCVVDLDYIARNPTNKYNYNKEKNKSNKNIKFIETMPCIEFWFLLHFYKIYSTRLYENYESLKNELKKYLPDYDKSENYFKCNKIYQKLKEANKLENAISYAQKLLLDKENSNEKLFPFTKIHLLLLELQNIGKNISLT
jgi:hypothetical protein